MIIAALSMDGKYSTTVNLLNHPVGSSFKLAFGESKNIKITKEDVLSKKDKSWLKGVLNGGYTIEIINGLDRTVTVTVNDRVPEPVNSKISLTNLKINPKPVGDGINGVYKWELTLIPNETKKINVTYDIKYPSDANICFR